MARRRSDGKTPNQEWEKARQKGKGVALTTQIDPHLEEGESKPAEGITFKRKQRRQKNNRPGCRRQTALDLIGATASTRGRK